MGNRRVTIAALGALLAALGVIAAGCGGGGSASASATTAASTTTTATGRARFGQAFQTFQTCLQQHGVTVPTFNRRPAPPSTTTAQQRPPRGRFFQRNISPKQQQAFQACRAKLPQRPGGGFGFRPRGGGAPNSGAFAKYTQCLKKHGVVFGKTSSPSAFRKAQVACRSLLPSRTTPPTTTTTTAIS